MTDNEIIKALEYCKSKNGIRDCENCPCADVKGCIDSLLSSSLNIINHQKAEIERNREIIEYHEIVISALEKSLESEKSEAIREFAEKIKDHCNEIINQEWNKKTSPVSWSDAYEDFIDDIDNLVKEITEGENDQ